MIIIGTGGLARDVVASMEQDNNALASDLTLFNNVDEESLFLDYYPVLNSNESLINYFKEGKDKEFIVCIGNPLKRFRMTEFTIKQGGQLSSFLSQKTCAISPFTEIKNGVIVQQGSIISRNVILEEGVFLNAGVILGHDVILNRYVTLGPGVRVLGNAEIGEFSYIGCNAIIMPGVKIGKKVRIGVGKTIDKDVSDNSKIM